MSQQEEEPWRYTRTVVVQPALSQMHDQLLPTSKSLEIAWKHHCIHRSAPRHVSVPRSRNFSDCWACDFFSSCIRTLCRLVQMVIIDFEKGSLRIKTESIPAVLNLIREPCVKNRSTNCSFGGRVILIPDDAWRGGEGDSQVWPLPRAGGQSENFPILGKSNE